MIVKTLPKLELKDAQVVSVKSKFLAINRWRHVEFIQITALDPVHGKVWFSSSSRDLFSIHKGDLIAGEVLLSEEKEGKPWKKYNGEVVPGTPIKFCKKPKNIRILAPEPEPAAAAEERQQVPSNWAYDLDYSVEKQVDESREAAGFEDDGDFI